MRVTFATYEHSRIGYPGVVLKWHVENGQVTGNYIKVNGIIQKGQWTWHNTNPMCAIEWECKRFDDYVMHMYCNDATVQR